MALAQLNPTLPPEASMMPTENSLARRPDTRSRNRAFHRMLVDGVRLNTDGLMGPLPAPRPR